MKYKIVGKKERNDALYEYVRAQELDHLTHTINLERFENLVKSLEDGPLRQKCIAEIPVLRERIKEVESILEQTYAQISDEDIKSVSDAKSSQL